MASDSDYTSFLEKANQDPSSSAAQTQSSSPSKQKVSLRAVDRDSDVPRGLRDVVKDQFYVSDADEEFDVVALGGCEELPSAEDFRNLTKHPDGEADVQIMDVKEWDPRGQYKDVVEGVRSLTEGEVRVYRVALGGTRCEYWVLGIAKEGRRLVGVRAGAVES